MCVCVCELTSSCVSQGLGKTVQIAAFTSHLFKNEGLSGPVLVVAPLSTLQHWRREYETWASYLNSLVYHGGAKGREIICEHEFKYEKVCVFTRPRQCFCFSNTIAITIAIAIAIPLYSRHMQSRENLTSSMFSSRAMKCA